MSPGATFERVYSTLKEQVLSGRFRPGEHLEPASLSEDLMSSITPVRDALHRLVGERLVQTPRGDGFRMPIYTEAALRDLYGWNLRLLHLAVGGGGAVTSIAMSSATGAEADGAAAATALLFEAIARASGSGEHVAAISSLNDRLYAVRSEEAAIIDGGAELDDIAGALDQGDFVLLRRLLAFYHRRRIGMVPQLLERLQPSF